MLFVALSTAFLSSGFTFIFEEGGACGNSGFQSCEDVNSYRSKKQNEWDQEAVNSPSSSHALIPFHAREAVHLVQAKRESDVDLILTGLKAYGLSSMSAVELDDAVEFFKNHVLGGLSRLKAFYKKEIKKKAIVAYYPGWISDFIGSQFLEAMLGTGETGKLLDEANELSDLNLLLEKSSVPGVPYLKGLEFSDPETRFETLVQLMKKSDLGGMAPGNLTPYHSRMILLSHLARNISVEERNILARALFLKTDLTDLLNPGDSRPGEPDDQFSSFIFHDGYFYGALPHWTSELLDAPSYASADHPHASADCSIFAQKILEKSGFSTQLEGKRISTGVLVSGGFKKIFSQTRLCSEQSLEPGDLVARSGHVYIFLGYEKNIYGFWDLKIAEATGSYAKTVREVALPLYVQATPNQANQCKNTLWGANLAYYRFRMR